MGRGKHGGAEPPSQVKATREIFTPAESPKKPVRATPLRIPKAQGGRLTAGTPTGTPCSTMAAARSRTQNRADGGTRGKFGKHAASTDAVSPRGSYRGCSSSVTSESASGNLEELLLSTTEDSARGADNVKVVIRVRPLNDREEGEVGNRQCVTVVGDRTVVLSDPHRSDTFTGTFDQVLGKETTQEDVYRVAGEAVVDNTMAGFNSSIFAYGQTGAGKTYTMQGTLERQEDGHLSPHCGLILRVFQQLFQRIAEEEQEHGLDKLRYSVKCSFLEIYNEVITDLLRPTSTGLNIRDGDIKKGVYVEELSETNVLNADDVVTLMLKGSANRHMAETKMNHESSRSHSVFTCTIEAHERTESGLTNVRYSKLNLIDLAGSERVGKSGATGERLTEAQNINKSLTTLGRVISALVERQKRPNTHVPYRDSRLTFLLQESLGGNSKTCIIANVSPSSESAQETYSTLLFAAGAKKIKNKAVVNEDTQGDMRALQLENARLARLLEEAQHARQQAQDAESEERVAELQEQLQQSEDVVRELRERNAQLETVFDQSNQTISQLQAEHTAAKKEVTDFRATTSRLTEDTVRLRSDNTSLSNELAQLRETFDQERDEHEGVVGQLRQELESLTAQLLDTEEAVHAARREAEDKTAQLAKERQVAKQLQQEVEQERMERRQAVLAADSLRDQLARADRDKQEAQQRQEASTARLKDQNQELFQALQQLRGEYEGLKVQLSEEVVRVAKYRRMATEIGNLVNAVQTNSPRVGRPAGARLISPLGRKGTAGFGRSGRPPLGVTIPSSETPVAGGAAPSPVPVPLGDASNRRNSMTPTVSMPSPGSFRSPATLSPSKHLVINNPAGRSPLSSPSPRP